MLKVRFIGPCRSGYCQDKVTLYYLVNLDISHETLEECHVLHVSEAHGWAASCKMIYP